MKREDMEAILDVAREMPIEDRQQMGREWKFARETALHGHCAGLSADGVVILYADALWQVCGGDTAHPSMKRLRAFDAVECSGDGEWPVLWADRELFARVMGKPIDELERLGFLPKSRR